MRSAEDWAEWILQTAEQGQVDGELSVSKLQSMLPQHAFTQWLTRDRKMLEYSEDGTVSMTELQRACEDFFCVDTRPRRVLNTHNTTDNDNHKQRVGAISSEFDG